jgi:hypothetical protein
MIVVERQGGAICCAFCCRPVDGGRQGGASTFASEPPAPEVVAAGGRYTEHGAPQCARCWRTQSAAAILRLAHGRYR